MRYLVPVVGMLAATAGGIVGAYLGMGIAELIVRIEDRVRVGRRRRG